MLRTELHILKFCSNLYLARNEKLGNGCLTNFFFSMVLFFVGSYMVEGDESSRLRMAN